MLLAVLVFTALAFFLIAYLLMIIFKNEIEIWRSDKLKKYDEQLSLAWMDFKPGTFLNVQLLLAVALFMSITFLYINPLPGLVAGIAGFHAPPFLLKRRIAARRQKFDFQMVEAMDILAGSIKSGQTVATAFQTMAKHMPKPISEEVGYMLASQKLGDPLGVALKRIAERMQSKNLDLIISSILIAEKTGGNLIETFQTLAESVRQIYQLENKIRTSTAQERMQGNILAIIPLALMVAMFFLNRPMIMPLFQTPVGIGILGVIILFEMVGLFFIRKLVHQEV
jgi:tight adherence protein B